MMRLVFVEPGADIQHQLRMNCLEYGASAQIVAPILAALTDSFQHDQTTESLVYLGALHKQATQLYQEQFL